MKKKICFAMMACIALAVWAAEPVVAPAAEPAVAEAPKAPNPVVRITTSVGNMLVELFEDDNIKGELEELLNEGRDKNYRNTYHLLKTL